MKTKRKPIRKPKPFRLSEHNTLECHHEIKGGDMPLRPHIFGTLDYLTYEDWPKLADWMNQAGLWLAQENSKKSKKR